MDDSFDFPEEGGGKDVAKKKLVPTFGMSGVHGGADPMRPMRIPERRKMSEEDIRQIVLAIGADNMAFTEEMKRLIRIGGIEFSPKNWALVVKACKDNAEMMLGAVGDKLSSGLGGDPRQFVLQVINNLSMTTADMEAHARMKIDNNPASKARYEAAKEMEAIVVSPDDPQSIDVARCDADEDQLGYPEPTDPQNDSQTPPCPANDPYTGVEDKLSRFRNSR